MAFYHQRDDLDGTTCALGAIGPSPEYRRDLAYAFKHLLDHEIPPGTITTLVREAANRDVQNDAEGRDYLRFLYHETLLNYEIDFEDET